ncbi:hypothetical protein AXF42_Ash011357 [Apostasia shenzhenica]|uniref:Type 2 DNA topoisomerase 6 subunit B-like n=1 Tax=Apostasia shenzhenica TaxID=1088818 RepID=A0A2I0AE98_9ASPA|nr:hypothetical protein AXF42_Ash011357 [Apostasia shenzhenica]
MSISSSTPVPLGFSSGFRRRITRWGVRSVYEDEDDGNAMSPAQEATCFGGTSNFLLRLFVFFSEVGTLFSSVLKTLLFVFFGLPYLLMADGSAAVHRIFQTVKKPDIISLISFAIQRCRLSGSLCRLTISLKCFRESKPPTLRLSISDTGVGSNLEEFRTLDFGASHAAAFDSWDVLVEYKDNDGSRCEHFLSKSEEGSGQLPVSNVASLCSGIEDYILEHRLKKDFIEDLKAGFGQNSNSGLSQNTGLEVEVAIVVIPVATEPCCTRATSQTTQVLYFDGFSPSLIPASALNALESINWKFYGLKLKGIVIDRDGHAVLEWENQETSNRIQVKKAVKAALDDLKAKYTGLFLSFRALKIQKYAPDLSRTIVNLISSSRDQDFQEECANILGLRSEDATNEILELRIQEKLLQTIALNDRKHKAEKDMAPLLFTGDRECLQEAETEDLIVNFEDMILIVSLRVERL